MITVVYGTRPEAIKLGPIVAELLQQVGPDAVQVVCTGQHTDLLKGTPAESDLAFSTSLGLASDGDIPRWVHACVKKLAGTVITRNNFNDGPEVIVVQGDTASAYAGAQLASQLSGRFGTVLCHVEAGVRSHNDKEPWPEERFRTRISELADWHYAPTSWAAANLLAEGYQRGVLVTGNPVVSALYRYAEPTVVPAQPHIVITLHRRELTQRKDFDEIVSGLYQAIATHPQFEFVWPVHPRIRRLPMGPPNLRLAKPKPYRKMIDLVKTATAVITDSGGLQEEAATLGVPTAVFRNVTDRPEAVEARIAALFPPSRAMAQAAVAWATHPPERRVTHIYGTPEAATIIAQHIGSLL